MFRITCFVDDTKVGAALRALTGVAKEQPKVEAVVNATVKGGKVVAKTAAGSQLELLKQKLDKMPAGASVARADVMEFLTKIGGNPSSSGGLLAQALKLGWLKRNGKPGRGHKNLYTVSRGAK
jgi:hypothetical protein